MKKERERLWVATKNKQAKDMNREPLMIAHHYAVHHYTDKAVVMMCGKSFPKEVCYKTEAELKARYGNANFERRNPWR